MNGSRMRQSCLRIARIAIWVCTELHTIGWVRAGGNSGRAPRAALSQSISKNTDRCGRRLALKFARGMRITNVQRVGSLGASGPISDLSYKITFSNELCTSSFPLYLMKPNLRNLFMKKLTRARVVPIISARIS
jgi:hypothetical protein